MKQFDFNTLMTEALIDSGIKIAVKKTRVHKGKHAPEGKVYFVATASRGKKKFQAWILKDLADLTPDIEHAIKTELEVKMKDILKGGIAATKR
ncbi:hypothetical protein [Pedobacter sp. SYP-B3415]|uniref:hypothetical protein n=1 Tax=Pedobacter sp. SYP-B3415 TaxID=2496641 RepID=UPI00101D6698|nr:hypothetical protein [Pedobacter sp. SYP-B3415]